MTFNEMGRREMSKGWIVAVAPKRQEAPEFFAPLSYGRDKEVSPELLLMRGRATVFETQVQAWKAAQETCIKAEEDGAEWPSKYSFALIEVTE